MPSSLQILKIQLDGCENGTTGGKVLVDRKTLLKILALCQVK